jgi:hypothetical protein
MNAAGDVVEDTGGGLGGSLPVVVRCDRCGRKIKRGVEYGTKLYGAACLRNALADEFAAFNAKQIVLFREKQKPPHQAAMERRYG